MSIQRGNFHSDLISGLVDKWFSTRPTDIAPLHNRMFQVLKSNQAFERNATITGFSSMSAKHEDGPVLLDSSQEAQKPVYEHTTFALGFAMSMELMEDGIAFSQASRFTDMLKRAAMVTKEIVAANVINYAATSGYTQKGGDGVVLASASHPTASGLQSNILSGGADLSEASLEAIRTQIKRAKDNRGLYQQLAINTLIISPEQEAEAHRILHSLLRSGTANNDTNFLKDMSTVKDVVVNPYLTSTTQWQVTTTHPDGLKFYVRKEAQIDKDNVFLTAQGIYRAIMRISAGWDDFRGIYFSL
jgi:hypothetical protein